MKCDPNIDQLDQIFRSDSEGILSSDTKSKLHEKLWSENVSLDPISESNRCICWRYLLCLISPTNKNDWANELNQSVAIYVDMKSTTSPSVINVGLDPLSDENPDILSYFDSLEKVKSIELDLNRLYMSGIDDEYFQTKRRKGILQSVLLLWSVQNPSISYRQGMHEIVGTILYCVERELEAWTPSSHLMDRSPLAGAFTEDTVEAHTYWLFTGVLMSLGALYDPTLLPPVDGLSSSSSSSCGHGDHPRRNEQNSVNNGVPRAVLFLLEFQGRYLRDLDPELWNHLRANDIHPQFFGLRWSRLLLGREFRFADTHVLRIWDCLFSADAVDSVERDHLNGASQGLTNGAGAVAVAGYPPMLTALREFMLAMLIHMRAELIDGDSSVILSLLMRFPDMEDLGPIFRIVSSLRKGQVPSPLSALRYESALAEEQINDSLDVSQQSQSTPLQQNGKIKGEDWDTPGTGPTRVTAASFHPSLLPYGQALMNAPAAWLSNLDFKTMSVPSMSSFSADNLSGFGRQGETIVSPLDYTDGQVVESSVPFLSPFPTPSHNVLLPTSASAISANTATAPTSQAVGSNSARSSSKDAAEGAEALFEVDLEGSQSSLSKLSTEPAHAEQGPCTLSSPALNSASSSNSYSKPRLGPPKPERVDDDFNRSSNTIPITSSTDLTSTKLIGAIPGRGKSDAAEQSWLFSAATTPARFSSSLEFLIGDCSGGTSSSNSSSSSSSSGSKKNLKERTRDSVGPLRLSVDAVDRKTRSDTTKVGGASDIPPTVPTVTAVFDVRDKLLCIAEDLLNAQHARTPIEGGVIAAAGLQVMEQRAESRISGGGLGGAHVPGEVEALQASLKAESRQRTDTAKKLLLLANVLSGRATMQEYSSLYDKVP